MYKKLFWLLVAVAILCCSPVWANSDNPWSEYIFAAADQKQQPASISSIGKVPLASPLDTCYFTNACFNFSEMTPCHFSAPFPPGTAYYAFQDPGKICPPSLTCPVYPFQVKNLFVFLANCQPGQPPCNVTLRASIYTAVYPVDPQCPQPGVLKCQGQQITVQVDQLCREYMIPIPDTCCVDTSYYACVEIVSTDCQNLQVCTDISCMPYWNYIQLPGQPARDLCPPLVPGPGDLAIWTAGLYSCQNICPKPPTGPNHYKTWRLQPVPFTASVQVKDQFMTDFVQLVQLELLSNPVRKIVFGATRNDTFNIVDPDDHLTWYRAIGKDTSLKVTYQNQLENTSVCIDSVKYLLVPADKDGHRQDNLDHYKAYRIQNPVGFSAPIQLDDQFDITPENLTSFLPLYFLTPCQKNLEPTYDLQTHYVAYRIAPFSSYSGPPHNIADQFFLPPGRIVNVLNSELLLVPTQKLNVALCAVPQETCCYPFVGGPPCGPVPVGTCVASGGVIVPACLGDLNGNGIDDACEPPTIDTLRNHFKTWRVFSPQPKDTFVVVRDQFTIHDFLVVDSIDFLSNPVRKIVIGPTRNDTSDITRPDDHLNWYRVKQSNNRRINVQVEYVNQFESTKVFIDTVKYFLLPTQKLFPSHPRPDSLLGHYTAYRIHKPKTIKPRVQLDDQFDLVPELIDSLVPKYFLTPARKENEPVFGPDTHYVAYRIFPQTLLPAFTTQTIDQWGQHFLQVRNSEYLLVPTDKRKVVFCTYKPNDCNGDGNINLTDIICDVNVVFKPATNPKPVPNCRCDSNGDGQCNLTDIIHKVNYVFRSGPEPAVSKECCIPASRTP